MDQVVHSSSFIPPVGPVTPSAPPLPDDDLTPPSLPREIYEEFFWKEPPQVNSAAPVNPSSNVRNDMTRKTHTTQQASAGDVCKFIMEQNFSYRSVTPPPDAVDDDFEPSAPSLDSMDLVQGYEGASFESVEIPPPLIPGALISDEEPPQRVPLQGIPQLTEKEVRQALRKEVASHCCYGSGTVKDMAVTDIRHSLAFNYTLETFTEKRMTCWTFVPYAGGSVDSSTSGLAPFPWDIPVVPPKKFQNQISQTEVPHTASIKNCHMCGGVGRKRCATCTGNGWEYCFSCHGDGHKVSSMQGDNERCYQCHGTGRRRCWKCNGDGMASCKSCAGTGQIKCFIRLTVVWTNHLDDYVVDKAAAIQGERLRSVTGDMVFEEEQPLVWPLDNFPDTAVNIASVQLIQQHATSFAGEKVILQRQRVHVIPIAAIHYKWKNHDGLYHVYGYERKVYAPDYPQTCFCCTIV